MAARDASRLCSSARNLIIRQRQRCSCCSTFPPRMPTTTTRHLGFRAEKKIERPPPPQPSSSLPLAASQSSPDGGLLHVRAPLACSLRTAVVVVTDKSRVVVPPTERPGALVLDKDFTLEDQHANLALWARRFSTRLEVLAGESSSSSSGSSRSSSCGASSSLARRVENGIGWDAKKGKADPGSTLVVGSWQQVYDAACKVAARETGLEEHFLRQRLLPPEEQAGGPPEPQTGPLFPLGPFFTALRGAGIRIAVCTNDNRRNTLAFLDKSGARGFVEAIACSDDGLPKKPHPAMLEKLLRELGVPKERAWVVGDSRADVEIARNARVAKVVGVGSGFCGEADLPDADYFLERADKVLGLLGLDLATLDEEAQQVDGKSQQ